MTSVNVTTQKNTVTVNGETSVVTVTVAGPQGASGPQGPSVSDGDKGAITVSNSGATFAVNDDVITTSKIADDAVTADKLANSINTEIAANTAKVSNATHTGDVTGSTALTIADDAVTYAKIQNVSATDRVLGRDSSGAGVIEEITPANLRTMINVEDGATGDQTAAEIRTLVESASDSNVFTDADHTKLNNIETAATADQTGAEIKSLYEAESDTNAFSDAEKTKLSGIEASATADQTDAEIKTAYENNSNTNAYTDAEKSKLAAIEASADVTDSTNVDAAGAVMNSDSTTAAMSFVVDEDNMSSDSATKVPTQQSVKAYVDTEVAGVVDSAPSALNTLNELAAALGDDANFSTTVTNSIGTKLPLAGGTMTGNIVMSGSQTVDGRDVSADGAKLDGIATGAEVNVQADFNETDNTSDAFIKNKPTIPTNNNQLTNGAGFTTNTGTVTGVSGTAPITSSGGTTPAIGISAATTSDAGSMSAADKTKLDAIESGATADQTDAEIRAAVEAASDSNVFTDADHTKLNGIEASATADQTDAEIKTAYENNSDTNAFTDAEKTKLSGIEANATADQTAEEIQDIVGAMLTSNTETGITVTYQDADGTIDFAVASQTDENFTTADHSKLDGIESNATADQTGAEIKSLYEGESDTNAFTDAEKTKLSGIETNATADQTASEIRTLVENASDSNVFTDADHTKLNGIAANANVGITDLVSDSSPQLGGDLDMNSNFISSGILGIKNQGTQSEMRLYCESNNAHYAGIKAPAHADFSGDLSFTLPSGYGSNGQVLQSNGSGGTSWVAQTTAYTNSSVDSHLNTSSASSGQILSWNGSDYAWVADQTGGGGGGGGISNLVEDTTPQLGGNLDMQTNNISGTGTVIANSTAVATAGMRKIHASTSAPSGSDGAVGDIWVKY